MKKYYSEDSERLRFIKGYLSRLSNSNREKKGDIEHYIQEFDNISENLVYRGVLTDTKRSDMFLKELLLYLIKKIIKRFLDKDTIDKEETVLYNEAFKFIRHYLKSERAIKKINLR